MSLLTCFIIYVVLSYLIMPFVMGRFMVVAPDTKLENIMFTFYVYLFCSIGWPALLLIWHLMPDKLEYNRRKYGER